MIYLFKCSCGWFHFIISLMSYHMHLTKFWPCEKQWRAYEFCFEEVRLPVLLIKINYNLENYSNLCKPQFVQAPNDNINNKLYIYILFCIQVSQAAFKDCILVHYGQARNIMYHQQGMKARHSLIRMLVTGHPCDSYQISSLGWDVLCISHGLDELNLFII